MKYLVITDVHANLAALEAILNAPEARACGGILSLGDQVNYGPQPRQVLQRLRELGAVLLLGNHEERMRHMDDGSFAGSNWALLRWTHAQLEGISLDLPEQLRLEGVYCTHAVPGNVNRLVDARGILTELSALPGDVSLLLTGHNHKRWLVTEAGRTACNPGAAGLWEDDIGCRAPFAVLDTAAPAKIALYDAAYDVRRTGRAYLETGAAQADPVLSRLAYGVMCSGRADILPFIRHAMRTAEACGVPFGDADAWQEADRRWNWPDGQNSETFWRRFS